MTKQIDTVLESLAQRVAVVRRWLVTLALLRTIVVTLLCGGLYVGLYAWVDHHLHLPAMARLTALLGLVVLLGAVLYRGLRTILGHISCHNAANYIERKHSFNQQLVTAIEYYESKEDYPYSKELTDYLVTQVDGASRTVPFDITVPKWQVAALTAVTVAGLMAAALCLYSNYAYFARYMARLTQPTAAIVPMPPTQLLAVSGDVVAPPETAATLQAEIHGRVPDQGRLVILYRDANDHPNILAPVDPIPLWPLQQEDQQPIFKTKMTLPAGKYRYRFEAQQAASQWHELRFCSIPEIQSITAVITPGNGQWNMSYSQVIEDYSLEVPEDARVKLTIVASEALAQATFTHLDGETETIDTEGKNEFTTTFTADADGFVQLALLSVDQAPNLDIPPLQIALKVDQAPTFSLIQPKGDYLATNGASVPVRFEVSDDFGLISAGLYWEINGQKPDVLQATVEKGSPNAVLAMTFEIEDYDLSVGDTILFYARAQDIAMSGHRNRPTATSDVYFIEIKPYRQLWLSCGGGLPNQPKQGLEVRKLHDNLVSILEYTRAILKKNVGHRQ